MLISVSYFIYGLYLIIESADDFSLRARLAFKKSLFFAIKKSDILEIQITHDESPRFKHSLIFFNYVCVCLFFPPISLTKRVCALEFHNFRLNSTVTEKLWNFFGVFRLFPDYLQNCLSRKISNLE